MPDQDIKELFDRFFRGTISPAEKEELARWIQENDDLGDFNPFLSQLEASWQRFVPTGSLSAEKGARILAQILQQQRDRTAVVKLSSRRWPRIAAAAVVTGLLGIGLYLFLHRSDKPAPAQEQQLAMTDIAPPKTTRATLTLSDGRRISLDSAKNGELTTQGNTRITRSGDGKLSYQAGTATGNTAPVYNTISLPRGSRPLSLTLADGTQVWLNTESSIRYPVAFTGSYRKVSITGEAWFEVSRDPSRPFRVSREGDPAEVEVLGTQFNVNAYADEGPLTVTLLEGAVSLAHGGHRLILKPGQQARAGEGGIDLISHPDLGQTMAWKEGRFVFNHVGLQAILRQLGRWYDLDVEYRDKVEDSYTVSVPRDVPVSHLFHFLELSGGVHFRIEGRKIIVSK